MLFVPMLFKLNNKKKKKKKKKNPVCLLHTLYPQLPKRELKVFFQKLDPVGDEIVVTS